MRSGRDEEMQESRIWEKQIMLEDDSMFVERCNKLHEITQLGRSTVHTQTFKRDRSVGDVQQQ